MEAYPPDYVLHNLPLVVLSGLDSASDLEAFPPVQDVLPGRAAISISSEIPPVTGQRAQELLREFLSAESRDAPWNGRVGQSRGSLIGFKLRAVGRDFQLPPRKADPPTSSSGLSPPGSPTIASVQSSWVLHSPISPLSPRSPVFPDGLMTPKWVAKHQHYLPSVFLSFFNFPSDPNKNSLHDNQLKTEINRIKGQIHKADHRTRYAVVLLSEKTILEAPDIEERLATIRRATGLDPKNSLFFLPPNTSQVELRSFVHSVLSSLQPVCIEYYRDLTKHARRKKGRGNIPPPTAPPTRGTSQTLPHQAWGVRYDFKLGVFAEFRQEMDAAQRHYNIAIEGLFGPDGVFETTASWSPRWDEIRLLADTIAIRYIRCLLWNGMPTTAVQAWFTFKSRLQDLLDRRGKGTSNYGWEAWESRWANLMGQLIQRAELPVFRIIQPSLEADPLVDGVNHLYSLPEKAIPIGERLPPWQLLHHPGYWYNLSAMHARRRMIMARNIPEEDRTPPGMSPAAKMSNRNQTYDYYLVPEPHQENPLPGIQKGFNHVEDIVGKLEQAIAEYDDRNQQRKVEQLQYDLGSTLLRAEEYEAAFKVLRPLWEGMSWRREGWWGIASLVIWALHECALRVQDAETYVATEWELYDKVFTAKSRYRHDLSACLDSFPSEQDGKPSITLNYKDFISCLSTSFAFSETEGNVGEPLQCQITVASTARPGSAPITLSNLTVQFKGCLDEIKLAHKSDAQSTSQHSKTNTSMFQCVLQESSRADQKPSWTGESNLSIEAGQTKVFNFPITFRESGEINVVSRVIEINTDRFDLICPTSTDPESDRVPSWWIQSASDLKARKLAKGSGSSIKVLPKPPKVEIQFPNLHAQYYTDEETQLDITIINKEEEDTEAVLEVRLLGRAKDALHFSWAPQDGDSASKPDAPASLTETESSDLDLPGHVIGRLAQGAKASQTIRFKAPPESADYALEVKVLYHLLSDRDIPISKTSIADLIFVSPFEVNYEFTPRVHHTPWPNYFQIQKNEIKEVSDDSSNVAFGITQKWKLSAKTTSFAKEPLLIQGMNVEVHQIHGGAICTAANEFTTTDLTFNPQDIDSRSFALEIQKSNLEERRATALDLSLGIVWRRTNEGAPSVTTHLPIPRIHVPSSEPRVLATATKLETVPGVIHLDYTLENPTMHFLTFEISMEASEEFGFSGPKLRSLHILPMSRQTIDYNIIPVVKGTWITPQLRVVDRYFNKTLKVLATDDMRLDKKGVGIWVDVDEEDT